MAISFAEAIRILEKQAAERDKRLEEQRLWEAEENFDNTALIRIMTDSAYVLEVLLEYGYTLEEIRAMGLRFKAIAEEASRKALE